MEDPVVLAIAQKHSKKPSQVLLRHLIQQDVVIIPKSVSQNRIQDNFKVCYKLQSFQATFMRISLQNSFDSFGSFLISPFPKMK